MYHRNILIGSFDLRCIFP